MNSPGWLADLPENASEAEYYELPEEISRTIEIVHGHVIKCQPPVPGTIALPDAFRSRLRRPGPRLVRA
jgi:hypothetical protein